jgi:hypothetical protein
MSQPAEEPAPETARGAQFGASADPPEWEADLDVDPPEEELDQSDAPVPE